MYLRPYLETNERKPVLSTSRPSLNQPQQKKKHFTSQIHPVREVFLVQYSGVLLELQRVAEQFGSAKYSTCHLVTAYEPLSLLQKGCEQMYYSDLLRQADNEETAAMRMVYVAAFVTSTYSVTEGRTKKAFTPLLGETYEFIDEKR